MYNKIKITMAAILLAGTTLFSTNANAQAFGIGAGLSIFSPTESVSGGGLSLSTTGDMQFGIVLKPYYNLNEKMRLDGHVLIYFGTSKSTSSTVQTGIDPNTFMPIYSTYTYTTKTSVIGFGVNYQYAFVGAFRGDGLTIYGLAGFTDFNESISTTGTGVSASASHGFFDFNIGAGAEYNFSENLCIFIEPRYSIGIAGASEDVLGTTITSKLGGFNMDAGLRYTFGGK